MALEKASERLYSSREMARIASPKCEGCGECCRGMGDTVHLDPYDIYILTTGLGKSFEQLLQKEVELHVENGLIIPNLVMNPDCIFLGRDGRCSIHAIRPGMCRLFPLGRQYEEDKVSYFVLKDTCPDMHRAKIRIDKWLGIPDLREYEQYKLTWHRFLNQLMDHFGESGDEEYEKRINMFVLKNFFISPYEDEFYSVYYKRLDMTKRLLNLRP